jgi:hypothetical protein
LAVFTVSVLGRGALRCINSTCRKGNCRRIPGTLIRIILPGTKERDFISLPDSLYQRVKDLPARIPAQLYQESNRVIGQPDAGDWGGYYLEVSQNGKSQFWLIDKPKANLPDYLHAFVDELEASVEQLK